MKRIEVKLDKVFGCEHEGYFLDSSSYDQVVDESCQVFDQETGEKLIEFRKGSLTGELPEDAFSTFKKVATVTRNGNRGLATGRKMDWEIMGRRRLSAGQKDVVTKGSKKKHGFKNFEEIEKILAENKDPSGFCWLSRSVKELDWEGFLKEVKASDPEAWPDMFQAFGKKFVDRQRRQNLVSSNVFGAFGRTGRNPYCRLSLSTRKNPEKYREYAPFFHKVDEISQEAFPERHASMKEGLSTTDPEFTLMGTAFTSITVNWNFRLASHFDGRNFPGGFATLTVFEEGDFDGHYLVFPEIRLAFNLREGDTISADTHDLLHGNTAKEGEGERVSLVFFTREDVSKKCRSKELDAAREAFWRWSKENLADVHAEGRTSWMGTFPGMYDSPEWYEFWEDYKERNSITGVELLEIDKLSG